MLLQDEQLLLRVLLFQVHVELPHPLLLNLSRSLGSPTGVVQMAVCILNDTLLKTSLAGISSAAALAAAALHLASLLAGGGLPATGDGRPSEASWWIGLGIQQVEMENNCHIMLDAITQNICQ